MASNGVKLLGFWSSPYVIRARIALNIKSVDYEFLEENFRPKSELLLRSNPVYKRIPVLFHGDKIICESLIIVEYIDEFWSSGSPILPLDPHDRAVARFWAAYIDDKWFPSIGTVISTQSIDEASKAAAQQLREGLELLEEAFKKCSSGKKFFGGDEIGYLDIALGCFLAWLRAVQKLNIANDLLDNVITPNLCKWAEDFCADSAVKDVMPETDRFVEFAANAIIPKMRAQPKN